MHKLSSIYPSPAPSHNIQLYNCFYLPWEKITSKPIYHMSVVLSMSQTHIFNSPETNPGVHACDPISLMRLVNFTEIHRLGKSVLHTLRTRTYAMVYLAISSVMHACKLNKNYYKQD